MNMMTKKSNKTTDEEKSNNFFDEEETDKTDKKLSELERKKKVNQELRERETKLKKGQLKEMEEVLEVDPTAYDYDKVYDKMKDIEEEKKKERMMKQSIVGKPKFMDKLIENSKVRKIENDIANAKKLKREAENDKEKYGDTPQFMTSSYKKKDGGEK
eukprot:TRINITY_DN2943_c0_g2_i1.p1 TRINITY_DN2943_c0_g2~~TRINITY_DN2943_c0_g2_i1.p1  ORF type:complete len:171 (-),score=70.00 TRINITY_DN2943_c0_g2_i1:206-679(-)